MEEKVPLQLQSSSILTVWLHSRWPPEDISNRVLSENTIGYGLEATKRTGVFASSSISLRENKK